MSYHDIQPTYRSGLNHIPIVVCLIGIWTMEPVCCITIAKYSVYGGIRAQRIQRGIQLAPNYSPKVT